MHSKRSFRGLPAAAVALLLLPAWSILAGGCTHTRAGIRRDARDAALATRVKANLAVDTGVDAYQIDVDTRDGVVTLRGRVDSEFEKRQATTVTLHTGGVRGVHNLLLVGKTSAGQRFSDAWISSKVKSKLLADTDVRGLDIDVDTVAGEVTLSGMADSPQAILQAVQLARNTAGVKRVINNIVLRERRGAIDPQRAPGLALLR